MEKIEKPLCSACGAELDIISREDEEMGNEYQCPNCGVIEMSYPLIDEEDQKDYPAYNEELPFTNGFYGYEGTCPECGSNIVWGADFMRSEVLGDIPLTEEGEKLANELEEKIAEEERILNSELSDREKQKHKILLNKFRMELSNIQYDYIDDNEDSLAANVTCPYCGASIDVIYPRESDKKNYPFYNKENN